MTPPLPSPETGKISRRTLIALAGVGAAGLALGVYATRPGEGPPNPGDAAFAPDAWLRIDVTGDITILVDRSEMGQGVTTALPMLLAEELDADWTRVTVAQAGANPAYTNALLPGGQLTGGSTSVRAAWTPLREAGAAARAMLVAAAAADWAVSPDSCTTARGEVVHAPSGRRLDYGSLAARAAEQPVPQHPDLKAPAEFSLIGRDVPRVDVFDKVTGRAGFGMDARPAGCLVAVVERCPVFGGTVAEYDAARAAAMPGVRRVVPIEQGIAVVADSYWQAHKARQALTVTWNGSGSDLDDQGVRDRLRESAAGEGRSARQEGDPETALAGAVTRLDAEYDLPYLAHTTMEPMNCTAHVRDDGVDLWVPTQFQTGPFWTGGGSRGVAADIAGVSPRHVTVHTTYLGGGFGRRSETDFVAEACQISKAVGRPVQIIWSREDDVRHDFYRPASHHRLSGGLDADGRPVAWTHRVACQSILARFIPGFVPEWATRLAGPLKGGVDPNAVEGARELPYAIPHLAVSFHRADLAVPVGFWRSVGHTHNAFVTECFVDELAALAGADPVAFRSELLAEAPRLRAVLELAAARAEWGTPLPEGRARGVATHASFGSYVAQVAEVSVDQGNVRVHRVVCAADCGMTVHPRTVRDQMESGIVYGLTAALHGRITVEGGRVRQSNFHDYRALRLDEMPDVEVHLVTSAEAPGGAGEPGTPPIAPAVANAVAALTGRRIRALPIDLTTVAT